MPDFFIALTWALAALLGTAGWGRLVQRAAFSAPPAAVDWLNAPSLGLAALAFVGGMLNLVHLATREVLVGVVLAGVAAVLLDLNRRRKKEAARRPAGSRGSWENFFPGFVITLLTLRFISAIVLSAPDTPGVTLNPHDDMHSYLVSVARMLQTGTLGLDPFNDRSMVASLGPQHFLNAIAVAPLSFDSIHLAEDGLGLVALTLSTAAFVLRLGLSRNLATGLMVVPLAFHWIPANISSSLTAAATLLALACALLELPASPRGLLPAAFLLFATYSLKSTMFAPAGCLLFLYAAISTVLLRDGRALRSVVIIILIAAAFAVPWMVWQHQASGTFLYPLLGRGNHIPDPTATLPLTDASKRELLRNLPLPAVCLLAVVTLSALRPIRRNISPAATAVTLAFLAAWLIQWPLLTRVTQYPDLWRYILPVTVPAVVVTLAFVWRSIALFSAPGGKYVPSATLLVLLLLTMRDWVYQYGRALPHDLYASFTYAMRPWSEERAALADLQSAIPPHEPFIAYLTTPALLNFSRNAIYIVDWPGECSPPPLDTGMPIGNAEALAAYLLEHHIRYLAYSYAAHANFYPQVYKEFLAPQYGAVIHRQVQQSLTFQESLSQLARTHKIIYNNGADFVIDLAP